MRPFVLFHPHIAIRKPLQAGATDDSQTSFPASRFRPLLNRRSRRSIGQKGFLPLTANQGFLRPLCTGRTSGARLLRAFFRRRPSPKKRTRCFSIEPPDKSYPQAILPTRSDALPPCLFLLRRSVFVLQCERHSVGAQRFFCLCFSLFG